MFKFLRKLMVLLGKRADTIIALSGILVASLALWFTVDQSKRAEKIERLRWEPELAWGIARNHNDGFTVALTNEGLGPARVKWVQVFWEDERMPHWTAVYLKVNESEGGGLPSEIDQVFGIPHPETVILAEGERSKRPLLSERHPVWRDGLWRGAQKMSFAVCYCSLLQECKLEVWTRQPELIAPTISKGSCSADTRYSTLFDVSPDYLSKNLD